MLKALCCFFAGHDWTSAAMQGKKPTPEQLKSIEGFLDYSRMYCARCGKVSDLNKKFRHERRCFTEFFR